MDKIFSYVLFELPISVHQEIVDTSTGEILYSVDSNVLSLNVKYFTLVLFRYIKLLRERRYCLQLNVRTFF